MFYLNVIIIIIIIIIIIFSIFIFFFYLWNFFPVTRFLVTPLLVTRYSVTLFSNTRVYVKYRTRDLRFVNNYVFTPVSLRVTCTWVSEFRLFLPYICLPETKKIHLVLYIKFSDVLSNVYDKTELLMMQRNKDGSNYIVRLFDSEHHF